MLPWPIIPIFAERTDTRPALLSLHALLATTPLAAQTIVFDPHIDLPKAIGPDWSERTASNS